MTVVMLLLTCCTMTVVMLLLTCCTMTVVMLLLTCCTMTVVMLLLTCCLWRPIDFTYVLPPYFTSFMVFLHFTILVCMCVSVVCHWLSKPLSIYLSTQQSSQTDRHTDKHHKLLQYNTWKQRRRHAHTGYFLLSAHDCTFETLCSGFDVSSVSRPVNAGVESMQEFCHDWNGVG